MRRRLLAIPVVLFLASMVGHARQAPGAFYGTPLGTIRLEGPGPDPPVALPIRPGDLLTPANVRDAIQKLYDTGQYSYIEVDAAGGAGVTDLVFRLRPVFFFGTIHLRPQGLIDRPLSGFVQLPIGDRFSSSKIEEVAEDVVEMLKSRGYLEVSLEPEYDFDSERRLVSVTLNAKNLAKARIRRLEVRGGEETFSVTELADAVSLRPGTWFTLDALDRGLERLRRKFTELGFLNTRTAVTQTYDPSQHVLDLEIVVEPGPFTLVQVRGHDVSKGRLRDLMPFDDEGAVDTDLIEEGRQALLAHLQQRGFFDASVRAISIEAPLDNAYQINYEVERGGRHRVSSVSFEGNRAFSTELLRAQLRTSEGGILSRGAFSGDLLKQDAARIESFYRNAGYESARVTTEHRESADHSIGVFIRIDEGAQTRVESVVFRGNTGIPTDELHRRIPLRSSDVYTFPGVEAARSALVSIYYGNGFPNVQVVPTVTRSTEPNKVEVEFGIIEGESFEVGEIFVSGNVRTAEKIVHRNSGLYRETPFNPEELLAGQQRLYATGLFERVDVVPLAQGRGKKRNLLIQVDDAPPVLFTYGFGVQDREGPRGTVEISHSNLFGLDRSLGIRVRGSKREQRVQATYREPRLFNWDLDGFASLFAERTHQRFFDASRFDASIQSLKKLSPNQNLLVNLSYQTVNLRDIRVNRKAEEFPEEEGVIQIGKVGASLIRDFRDDAIDPHRGSFVTVSGGIAHRILGSEVGFTSLYGQANHYRAWGASVLATSVRFGWNQPFGRTPRLPITERYFAGGSTTLRSFDLDTAGPEGGGNVLAIANTELRVPMPVHRNLGAALFYDTGTVFEGISKFQFGDFTHTAGVGLRYVTPVGPVRVDLGLNLNRKPGEKRRQFTFTLGHTF